MAAFALIAWPLVSLALFVALGRARGLIWSVVIGYLFLPEAYGFDVPALPPYDKYSAIAFAALLGVFLFREEERDLPQVVSRDTLFRNVMIGLFLVLAFIGPIMTWLTNPETLVNGPLIRPDLTPRDAIRLSADMIIRFLPMFLAWQVLTRPEHQRELLIAVVTFGVVYTFLVLFERRMSPQLNNWIYGYFSHSWLQHIRGGGFRPIVFLSHGLAVGLYLLMATLAAFALSRDRQVSRLAFLLLAVWLLAVLFLSRNFGATLLALVFCPLVLVLGQRTQIRIASVIAILFLLYPASIQLNISPGWKIVELVQNISPDRAASFGVRLANEEELLLRAFEKPLFGWGGWARAHIVNEWGRDMTLIDGIWIVVLGQRGWVGFLAFFGLIILPIFFLRRTVRRKAITPVIGGMVLIMAANIIDMVPNSTFSPIGLLILGTIAAFVQYDVQAASDPVDQPEQVQEPRTARYTRFAPGGPVAKVSSRLTGPQYRRS